MKFTSILILLVVILLLSKVSDACISKRGRRRRSTNGLYSFNLNIQLLTITSPFIRNIISHYIMLYIFLHYI